MTVRFLLAGTCAEVIDYLSTNVDAQWTVLGASDWNPKTLLEIDLVCPSRRLTPLEASERGQLRSEIAALFAEAARNDPLSLFPVSAGVPLAIPAWNDLERLLAIQQQAQVASCVVVLTSPATKTIAADCLLNAGLSSTALTRALIVRLGRTILRKLCFGRAPATYNPKILWVTVGAFLADGKPDTYYGRLPWRGSASPLRIYQQGGKAIRLKASSDQIPVESLLQWRDIFSALCDVRVAKRMCRTFDSGDVRSRLVRWIWLDEIGRGEVFMLAIQKRAWKRLLSKYSPSVVVLPYEARAWERSLVRQARSCDVRCVGYQHSSLTPRHHAILVAASADSVDWIPDAIICCGQVTADRLARSSAAYQGRLHVGAALRASSVQMSPPGPSVLVALSSSRHEATELFQVFAAACKQGLEAQLIFRAHPTIPVRDLFDSFEWPPGTRFSDGCSLSMDIADACCIAYSSATVALEGMRYGRIPLYIDIGEVLSGDPIDEGLPFKLQANSAESLISALKILKTHQQNIALLADEARKYAEEYLIAPTEKRITEIIRWIEEN